MLHVVIVSYCSWKELEPTIDSFYNSIGVRFQLHVADNKGEDEIQLALESLANSNYQRFENLGYGEAFNRVVEKLPLLESDLVLVSNDDVQFHSSSLNGLMSAYANAKEQFEKPGLIMPRYVDDKGIPDDRFLIGKITDADITPIEFSPGAFWLMDVTFLKEVGGFAPGFFLYGEDRELAYRADYFNFQNVLCPHVQVQHDFDYPVKIQSLKMIFERNVFGSQYMRSKVNNDIFPLFVIRSFLSRILRLQIKDALSTLFGYIEFRRDKDVFQKNVESIKNSTLQYRFIKTGN
jgi:GT2 family glycosyltransferase